jgi:hypothetical protein
MILLIRIEVVFKFLIFCFLLTRIFSFWFLLRIIRILAAIITSTITSFFYSSWIWRLILLFLQVVFVRAKVKTFLTYREVWNLFLLKLFIFQWLFILIKIFWILKSSYEIIFISNVISLLFLFYLDLKVLFVL